ncbi:hypothetical protein [Colwellia piezophila]|uniref:hypothetical protein n=1 Tax=Colwellia piezophila TaxID=211668 RepID=UPI000376875C|nr:hypothetical protein [Colwellia piezophila]
MKIVGILSLAIGLLLFILGMSTFFWSPTKALLNDYSTSKTVQYGYTNVEYIARAYKGGSITEWQSVSYSYKFNNEKYTSSFMGFYLPFNNKLPINTLKRYNEVITAYVLPFIPRVSVIKKGFDYRLVGVFLLIGITILFIRAKIIKFYGDYA